MVAVDKFVGELQEFFKDLRKFLLENLQEYTMEVEDVNERDRLVMIVEKLNMEALGLLPQDDDMYENPYTNKNLGNNEEAEDGDDEEGVMDTTYYDPDIDRQIMPMPPVKGTGNQSAAVTETMSMKEKKEKKEKRNKTTGTEDNASRRSDELTGGSKRIMTSADMKNCEISGVMKKQITKSRSMLKDKKYWCAIKEGVLYYFEEKNRKHKGQIVLKDYTASETDKKYVFQLACPGRNDLFFATPSNKELHQWVSYINTKKLPTQEPKAELYELEEPGFAGDEEEGEWVNEDFYETPEDQVKVTKEAQEEQGTYDDTLAVNNDGQPYPATENIDDEQSIYEDTLAATNDSRPSPALKPHHDYQSTPMGVGDKGALPQLPTQGDTLSPAVTHPPIELPVPRPPAAEESGQLYCDPDIMDGQDNFYDDGESALPLPPPLPTADILRRKPESPSSSHPPTKKSSLLLPTPPSQNFEAMHYGLWACEGVGQDELEFQWGACIEVVNKDMYGSWGWWVGKLNKKVGLVPKDYLYPVYKQM